MNSDEDTRVQPGVVIDIDDSVLKDLESKYADVACPVHGGPPVFEVAPDGSVVERMCCEALLQIVRELQVAAGERDPTREHAAGEGDAGEPALRGGDESP